MLCVWADEQDPLSTRLSQQPPSLASTLDPKSVPHKLNLSLLHTVSKGNPDLGTTLTTGVEKYDGAVYVELKAQRPSPSMPIPDLTKNALVITVAYNYQQRC